MPRSPSASSAPQACNCDQYLKVSKDVMKQLVRLSVHPGGPGGASEWGSGVCGRQPCRWVLLGLTHLGHQGGAHRRGGARKGTGASGPRDLQCRPPGPLGSCPLPFPQWALLSHPDTLMECTCTHAKTRFQAETRSAAHTLTCLPVHAQPRARLSLPVHARPRARSHARLCTLIPACARSATCTLIPACAHSCLPVHAWPRARSHLPALVPRASPGSRLNVGEPGPPGRRASPGCPDQGPSLSFPAWRAGGNGRRASWDSLRREPEPRAPLHSWCPWVPSSLLAAPALPASLEVSGPPTQWMSDGDGQCPALGSSLLSAERLQLA